MNMLDYHCRRVHDNSCIIDPVEGKSRVQEYHDKQAQKYSALLNEVVKTGFLIERECGLLPGGAVVDEKNRLPDGGVQFNIIDADSDVERQRILKSWVEEYGAIGDASRASNPRSKKPS